MLPEAFKKRMEQMLGEEYAVFLKQYDKEALRGFRVNTLKIPTESIGDVFPYSLGQVSWCNDGFYYDVRAGKHPCALCGLIYSQEPSAMIAAEELNPSPGERVLDLCAAPGGKSTQLAAKLKGEGLLVSNEIVPQRAATLVQNLERMGVRNAVVTNMSPEGLEKEFPSFFDKILVDAPCSGEGMFRKDAEAILHWSEAHVNACANRQRLILSSAVSMLKQGGHLVYSTCTFSREENENTALWLENSFPEMELISMKRLMPHTHKGEGHFAAHFVKTKGDSLSRGDCEEKAQTQLFEDFQKENLNTRLSGRFLSWGERLFLVPPELGSTNRLKILRPGLFLGENKKGRFDPAHALCMALKKEDFARTAEVNEKELEDFYKGNTLSCSAENGYTAVLWKGYGAGWGKAVNSTLKNHIPKALRF